jgi:PAS domain S-box-containing protein
MLAAHGLTDKEIAERLSVSPGTLRTYWERARSKMDARSRSHVIAKILESTFEQTQRTLEEEVQYLRLFVASSAVHALIATDAEGIIKLWNPGVEHVFGYAADEWIGQHLRIVYSPEDQRAMKPERDMAEVAFSGPHIQRGWHARKDGLFWGRGTLFALWDGEIKGFGKIMSDESESLELINLMRSLCQKFEPLLGPSS